MSRSDGFLSRWSRRKHEARAAPPEPAAEAGTGPADALAPPAAPSPGAAELSEAELAALPRPEDLTAQSDLAPFLRSGVPVLLRKAALRRMWTLDPAIRDFVGEARDYSYDWNVPGGVPVSGPLLPGDDVEGTLGRLFSRLQPDPDSGTEPVLSGADADATAHPEPAAERDGAPARESEGGAEPQHRLAQDVQTSGPIPVASGPDLAGAEPQTGPPSDAAGPASGARRHGAARPKFD